MKKYQLFAQKMFETREKFEDRLNEECRKGYRPLSIAGNQSSGGTMVLLEKVS